MGLSEHDERRHPHDRDPRWRESLYFGFVLPEASLGAVVYLRVDPNAGTVNPMVLLYERERGVAYAFQRVEALPPDFDLENVEISGFRLQCLKPLERVAVAFDGGDGTALEFQFTGLHPPFDYARNRSGCPPTMATNRFEQGGRIEGELRFRGQELRLGGFAQRDHSWGVRDWDGIQHYKWISAGTEDGAALNAFQSIARGEVTVNGYFYDGRELVPLVAIEPIVSYAGTSLRHEALRAALVDERGRRLWLEGEVFARAEIPIEGSLVLEGAATFSLDGRRGVGIAEFLWPRAYFDHWASTRAG
jgi:hypothetical protein